MGRPKKDKSNEDKLGKAEEGVKKAFPDSKAKELIRKMEEAGHKMKMASEINKEPKIRTGIFALDYVLDGGISLGDGGHRIEFYGKESSGKTTFATLLMIKFQQLGKKVIFIDAEQSFDPSWAARLGLDADNLPVLSVETLEQAGEAILKAIDVGFDLIVIDSIPALTPGKVIENTMEERTMGLAPQLFAILCSKMGAALSGKTTTLLFINQIREKVGIAYGNPQTTPGGHALKHFYSTRIEFKPKEYIEEGTKEAKTRIGVTTSLFCEKNKKGKPKRVNSVDLYYNGFIDNRKTLFYMGIKYGIIEKAGAWFKYGEHKYNGEAEFIQELDKKYWLEIEDQVWENINK